MMGNKIFVSSKLDFTPIQALYGIDMLINHAPIIEWCIITAKKKQKFHIDNSSKNARQVRYNYSAGNIVYVYKTGIYQNIYYKKHGTYRINE